MSSLKGFSYDNEKLDILLKLFEQGELSLEQAQDLKLLLEQIHRSITDPKVARKIGTILITLKGIISGRISLENDRVSVS